MNATSIAELKEYLIKFKKDVSAIDIRRPEVIPKFSIPNWPEEAGSISVALWFRRPWYYALFCDRESTLLNLRRRLFRKIVVSIDINGNISVCLFSFIRFEREICIESKSLNLEDRTMCFIIFSQFLDLICGKIISRLKRKYLRYKLEVEEFNQVCEAVKRSFEPLIPFVVADTLSDDNEQAR